MTETTSILTELTADAIKYKTHSEVWIIPNKQKRYEVQVTAFISLVALKNCENFVLLNNVDSFGDIILHTTEGDISVIYIFKVEYNDVGVKGNHEDLLQIFHYYNESTVERWNKKILPILSKKLKNSVYLRIIHITTKSVDTTTPITFAVDVTESENNIFSTGSGKNYMLQEKNITTKHDERHIYLQSIKIYSEQSQNPDGELINFIQDYVDTDLVMAENIKLKYVSYIINWLNIKTRKKRSLSKEIIFRLLMLSMYKVLSSPLTYNIDVYQNYIKILGEERSNLLWKYIKDNNVNIEENHTAFIKGKIYQDLQEFQLNSELHHKYFKQILSDSFLNREEIIYDMGCMLGILPVVIHRVTSRKTIQVVKINFFQCQVNFGEINIDLLSAIGKITVRTCSGQIFNIKNIVDEIGYISISDILSLIIDSHNTEINENFFLERKLNKVLLDERIFSPENIEVMKSNNLFIFIININGITTDEFIQYFNVNKSIVVTIKNQKQLHNILALSAVALNYKYILTEDSLDLKISNTNVHFFKVCKRRKIYQVEWTKTNGSTESINKFRISDPCRKIKKVIQHKNYEHCKCCVNFEDISNYFQNPFMVISGVPGVGKTIFLKQFARSVPNTEYVLFVSLIDHYDYFENFGKNKISANEHINYFFNENNTIFKRIFQNKLKLKKILILFDGLDEIAPRYTNTVSKIITQIKEDNNKIILTTRSVIRKKVEDIFGTLSISLSPFNELDQKTFLEAHLKKYNKFTIETTQYIGDCINSDSEFYSIPFHLQLCLSVITNENFNSKYKINKLELYETFLDYKLKAFTCKFSNNNINKVTIEAYHKLFSIRIIFGHLSKYYIIKDELNSCLSAYSEKLQCGGEKIGILVEDINEVFIHRTIAEYFAAKWAFDIFNSTVLYRLFSREKEFAEYILTKIYSTSYKFINENDKFSVIRLFFDLMINSNNKDKLHIAAFNANYKYIKEEFYFNIETVGTLNILKRTLLHTIILKNDYLYDRNTLKVNVDLISVIKLLISNFSNIFTHEDKLKLTVNDYIEQKNKSNNPQLKFVIYKTQVYFNRQFELWEIFSAENLYKCDLLQLLTALETENNKLFSIFDAVKIGNSLVIKEFFNSGINMDIKLAGNNKHLLHFVTEEGFLDIIKLFEKHEFELKHIAEDSNKRSLLHYAVFSGDVELVRYLKENGINCKTYDNYGYTPFHYAIIFNKINIVSYFLYQDFHPKFPSIDGCFTPIQYAAAFYNKEIYEFLLKKGALENCSHLNDTLIHFIASTNSYINLFLDDFVEHGTNNQNKIKKDFNRRCLDFLKFLLVKCVNINLKNKEGFTALTIATFRRNKTVIEFLIDNLADVDFRNIHGFTALHAAAYTCNKDILKLFLNINSNINATDDDGNSVLHYTIESDKSNCLEIVYFLIENGADPTATNKKGVTPLHAAIQEGNLNVFKLLIDYTYIYAEDINGNTVLHYAVYFGHIDMVKHLVEKNIDINITNNFYQTPLDIATYFRKDNIASYLVNFNGMSNCIKDIGWEPPNSPCLVERLDHWQIDIFGLQKGFIKFYFEQVYLSQLT